MKIEITRRGGGPVSFEAFADAHGLVMEVRERDGASIGTRGQFYASFRGVDVSEGCILRGEYGNGRTPEEAIAEYAMELRGKRIKVGYPVIASGQPGVYIDCPNEWTPSDPPATKERDE